MKIVYLDAFSGISGDMLLAALLDLGYPLDNMQETVDKLQLGKIRIKAEKIMKGPVAAMSVEVVDENDSPPPLRKMHNIKNILSDSNLPPEVKETALQVFFRIAEAEAKVHGSDVETIHFHEIGAVDTIVDVCCAVQAFQDLGFERIVCSPLPLGRGMIRTEHGLIPLPAPATVEILRGVPIKALDCDRELVTPTGAALVSCLCHEFGNVPDFSLEKCAYGAGQADLKHPNVLRLMTGRTADLKDELEEVYIIECNIDDMNPEIAGYCLEKCMEAGALDAFITPVQMKKNRPGIKLSVLVQLKEITIINKIILSETTTAGTRFYPVKREILQRSFRVIETPYGMVTVKDFFLDGKIRSSAPEYDDCRRLAAEHAVPIMKIMKVAEKAAIKAVE